MSPKDATNKDPAHQESNRTRLLEKAIGQQVRDFRNELNMTVVELARQAKLSPGMLSKLENGQISPSLNSLQALAAALNVPVTSLFRRFEEQRDTATFVKAGKGLDIERRGTRAGHQYQLLGHKVGGPFSIEPYLITLTETSDVFPLFQHSGQEFIYMISGRLGYRYADQVYIMEAGDSLFFDADTPHGPDQLLELPCQFLTVIVSANQE